MKILVVEDDKNIASFLKKGLEEEGFLVEVVYDGLEALYVVEVYKFDLIILDIMLPGIDGISLCKKIRESKITTPIIMLSAKEQIDDKVKALEYGANDYITKPFSFKELIARIKVQLRDKQDFNILQVEDLKLDLVNKKAYRKDKEIPLSKKEYLLLEYLMLNKNKLVTEEMINNSLWEFDSDITSNFINVYFYRLRQKIDKDYEI